MEDITISSSSIDNIELVDNKEIINLYLVVKMKDYIIDTKIMKSFYTSVDDVTILQQSRNDDYLLAQIVNNSEYNSDVDVIFLYYKDNKIVGAGEQYIIDLSSKKKETVKDYIPYNGYKNIEFDSYKILVNSYK